MVEFHVRSRLQKMGSHKDYMDLKRKKLAEQNQNQCHLLDNEERVSSHCFRGVSVYITGFTDPPASVLKEMILRGGGSYQMFYKKSDVTHIVATNLPDFKVKLWKNELIVTPQWIVDCDLSQSKLSEAKYVLFRNSENIRDMILEKKPNSAPPGKGKTVIPKTTSSDFVDEFYSNSRLHHLSTSVSELRSTVSEFQRQYHPMYTPENRAVTNSLIVHIDIDCFFVSISLRSRPQLRGLPVCVTHAKSTENTDSYAEISSCSYEARKFGVRNGMFMGRARKLCPELVTVPYEFEEYQKASREFYRILVEKTPFVEVVSCDEAFLDIMELVDSCDEENVDNFVNELRTDIFSSIGCTVSAGIGPNKLVARMATRKGKPNGQFICVEREKISEYLTGQPIDDLPGIGYSTAQKLSVQGLQTCGDLLKLTKTQLSDLVGPKTGETIFRFCRGEDDRELVIKHERKSISVEINYGIRVETIKELDQFLLNLCNELEKRMVNEKVVGSLITLKLKERCENAAKDPIKYMGHGICDNISKSLNLMKASNSGGVMHSKVMSLVSSMTLTPSDIRGVGVQMSKLQLSARHTPVSEGVAGSKKLVKSHDKREMHTLYQSEVPEFLGCKDQEQILDILKSWANSVEPMQIDVDKVDTYFSGLIKYGNISFVEKSLKQLRKIFVKRNLDEWNAVFNGILQNVQQKIFSDLNGILNIDNL